MAKLIIVRGLPGSGKSTYAKTLVDLDCADLFLEADQYFEDGFGNYLFDATKLHAAHKWCQYEVKRYLGMGMTVVVSNTFTTAKEMKPYIQMAEELGLDVDVIRMMDNFGSIHNVPDHTIERMRDRFVDFEGETKIASNFSALEDE